MANAGLLKDMRCPHCGSEGPYRIQGLVWSLIEDDGVLDDLSGTEWEEKSLCQCEHCDHEATVKDFTIKEKKAAI